MRKWLTAVGTLLFVASVGLLLVEAWRYRAALADRLGEPLFLAAIALAALAFAGLLVLLAQSWMLAAREGEPPPAAGERLADLGAYATCNIFKYLPGNIFHLVTRQALFAERGLRQGTIVRATYLELSISVAAAAAVGAAFLAANLGQGPVTVLGHRVGMGVLLAGLATLATAGLVAARLKASNRLVMRMLGLQAAYFVGYGALMGLLFALMEGPSAQIGLLVGGYLVAWLAGFLTPGAPGGLGIREVVFMAFTYRQPALAVEYAVVGRLVSVLGDLLLPVLVQGLRRWR